MRYSEFKKSVSYARRGLGYAWKHEQNFRVQIVVCAVVAAGALWFQISAFEAIVVALLAILVLMLELLNTAMEALMDILRPRLDERVEIAKDIMAGAVLLVGMGSAAVGAVIFWPHIVETLVPLWYNMTSM